jgi:DeoR/GlpR family transcriptional regulator of sugar metabolism
VPLFYNERNRKQTKAKSGVYLEERRQEILKLVNTHGRVAVADLSVQFGVSEVTIRADLQSLAESGLIVRTYGGAISATYGLQELSLLQRRQQHIPEKQRIGVAGAALVADGEAVFLDSSSTALVVAQQLKSRRDLTLVTNSLVIAQEMLGLANITVVMPGGTLHHDTVSLIGPDGLAFLEQYHIRKGFFGAYGLSVDAGLTDGSAPESEIKRALVKLCHKVIVVADATKWGRTGVTSYASLEDVDTIITDDQSPFDLVEQVRAAGVKVMLV